MCGTFFRRFLVGRCHLSPLAQPALGVSRGMPRALLMYATGGLDATHPAVKDGPYPSQRPGGSNVARGIRICSSPSGVTRGEAKLVFERVFRIEPFELECNAGTCLARSRRARVRTLTIESRTYKLERIRPGARWSGRGHAPFAAGRRRKAFIVSSVSRMSR